jgi:hypothetical protein
VTRKELRRAALCLATAVFLARPAAAGLIDVPTENRRAPALVDLASSSGLVPGLELGVAPVDEEIYLGAYRALREKGFYDPGGELLEAWEAARRNSPLYLRSLSPRVELRTYAFRGADELLLDHRSGEVVEEGLNAFASLSGAAFWRDRVGGFYQLHTAVGPGDWDLRVKRAYLKIALGKWSFKAGRDSERLGVGYHSSLLLDDGAPTLDLWRLRTEEPLFLPGFAAGLGGFRFSVFNAFLQDSHPTPSDLRYVGAAAPVEDPRLLGMRFSYHPVSWFDLGFSRAVLYGGRGREVYDSPKDWWELLWAGQENVGEGQSARFDNDQFNSYDLTLRLPIVAEWTRLLQAAKVYYELGGTDGGPSDWDLGWKRHQVLGVLPFELLRRAEIYGGLLSTGTVDFRYERAKLDDAWYRHHRYGQGYTLRGIPLGHHLGPGGLEHFFELSAYATPELRLTASLELEKRGVNLPSPERRRELTLTGEVSRLPLFGTLWTARIEGWGARVQNPLDAPETSSRWEYMVGVGFSNSF